VKGVVRTPELDSYGVSNCFEEFLVSKRPMYEVIGQLAFWGMLINGTQAVFRSSILRGCRLERHGRWISGRIYPDAVYFLQPGPIMLRVSSAAFFNISLLTMNFGD